MSTAYTVIFGFRSRPAAPLTTDTAAETFASYQVTAASPSAAVTAALTASTNAQQAAYQAAEFPSGYPGGVVQPAEIAMPHSYVVITGNVTITASGMLTQPQPAGSDGGKF